MIKLTSRWVVPAALGLAALALSSCRSHPDQPVQPQAGVTPQVQSFAALAPSRAPLSPPSTAVNSGLDHAHKGSPGPWTREFDPAVNPYAAALQEPGQSHRPWDPEFIRNFQNATKGDPIRFELTRGRIASGQILITQFRDGELAYISGELTEPEKGKFFFLVPPAGGKAGSAVGVIEFPASRTAYRIEPTGPDGAPELWQRRLDEVICMDLPRSHAEPATNQTAEMPPLRPDTEPGYVPPYNSNIVSLQSYPNSPAVLLLDFFGGYTPTWGGITYSRPANVNNTTIRDLWKRVAEDYMPFNVNVTTDLKVYQAAPAASRQRCCFTDTPVTAAGVAYIGSWNWGNDTPCWSVYTTGKNGAEVGAHEPGHTLGLGHMGSVSGTSTNEYYSGQGSGATGWAPIMGVGYYQPVATWAKGEYQYANNSQDELAVIDTQNNNVAFRSDDTGSTLATSRFLDLYDDYSAFAEGVIERSGDTDAFQFTTSGGEVRLAANPVGDWANLALSVTLADSTDTVISSNNPQSTLSATIASYLPAGAYTFRVTGAGRNDPFLNGFSAYGSLGYYSISGSVGGGRLPTRFTLREHAPVGTLVGTVPPSNPSVDPLAYSIVSGNTGNTFAIDSAGALTIANNYLLDYQRLASNTMFAVQFELLVNISNLSNPSLTELNRRVVIAILNNQVGSPIAYSGFNAGIIAPNTATVATPHASGFDIPNNYCFYEAGLNANAMVGGSGGAQGFPSRGTVLSQLDGTVFQMGPYGGNNALMLGYTYPASGTLTLGNPQPFNTLSFLASSANGGGNGTCYLNFANGSRSQTFFFNAQDWYGTTTNVAIQGFGRLKLGQSTLNTENSGWNNPNLYQTTLNLAALGLNQPVASLVFTKPAASSTTAILALSGTVMPPEVAISKQPVSATNSIPSQGVTFSAAAMGTPPLYYQWYFSATGSPGSYTPLSGRTTSSLVLSPELQLTNAGSYVVVVTNSFSAATSAVASLVVYRAPVLSQQPSPTNLVLLSGTSISWSVAANGAPPLSYSWIRNGSPVAGVLSSVLSLSNLQPSNSGTYAAVITNAYGSATSAPVFLSVSNASYPYAQLVQADHPIAYYRLDETSGSIAHDYLGAKNGSYNLVALAQPGNNLIDTHRSARFGALSSLNSYVGAIPVDFAGGSNAAFSVEAWVNGSAQSTDAGLITKGYGSGGEQFNLDCGAASHGFRFFVRDAGGNARLVNSGVVPNGLWHHLVGVCDQINGQVYLYVDGQQSGQASINAGSGLLPSTNSVTIGSRQSGANTAYDFQFVGRMEEVAIYNYALSAARVQAHYHSATNRAPIVYASPFGAPAAAAGQVYSASISTNAYDPNGDSIIFSKLSGPAWVTLSAGGLLSGTPLSPDSGSNLLQVRAADPSGLFSTATLLLTVVPAPPITLSINSQETNLVLTWSGGIAPYQAQTASNLNNPIWVPIGSTSPLILPATNAAAFYRVSGQ